MPPKEEKKKEEKKDDKKEDDKKAGSRVSAHASLCIVCYHLIAI